MLVVGMYEASRRSISKLFHSKFRIDFDVQIVHFKYFQLFESYISRHVL